MRKTITIVTIVAILAGCKVKEVPVYKPYPLKATEYIRIVERDTIHQHLLTPESTINVTRDTLSHLENSYCSSDASYSAGLLRHSLVTLPGASIPVTGRIIEVTRIDSVPYPVEVEVQVEVEKELTWYQRTAIKCFSYLLAGVVIYLLVFFRKEITGFALNIVRKALLKH